MGICIIIIGGVVRFPNGAIAATDVLPNVSVIEEELIKKAEF